MQGLTEVLFRKAYHQVFPGAIDLAVSPFLSLTHGDLSAAWGKIDDVLPEENEGSIPVVPQILGREVEEFVALANRLYDIGYKEVNWNIGCPVRRVAGKHRGSGILPYPEEVRQVLDAVVPRLKPCLSVKMRIGYRSKDEIFALVPILNDYPLLSVTIHPRIGKQAYTGVPDMETFSQVLPLIKHPVIYNGDITTPERYHYLREQYPQVQDFMIGRGVLYDPLLPVKCKGGVGSTRAPHSLPPTSTPAQFIAVLVDAILARPIPDEKKMRKIKEYWCLLYRSLGLTEAQRLPLLHAPDLAATLTHLQAICPPVMGQL